VHTEDESIPTEFLEKSAAHVVEQLGAGGVEMVGGKQWWKWAPKELTAEWIEMRKDWWTRTRHSEILPRTMFYVHGGLSRAWPGPERDTVDNAFSVRWLLFRECR